MNEGIDAQSPLTPQRPVEPVRTTASTDRLAQIPVIRNPEIKEREGLRINITINNKHLITHILSSMGERSFSATEHKDDIVALQNFAWGVSERCYDFVVGRLHLEQFFASGGSLEEVTNFLSQVEDSNEFGRIRQQTQEYLEFVKSQWEKNYSQSSQTIQELTGLDLNKEVTVNVTHPSLRNGQYLGNDTIAWGHHEDWQNYSTVYLWHEILHSYMDYTDLSHALIQFVTDNELRVRLNEGEAYPPFVGHENLIPLMEKLLPHWQEYLGETPANKNRDIHSFQERLQGMPEFQEKIEQDPQRKIITD